MPLKQGVWFALETFEVIVRHHRAMSLWASIEVLGLEAELELDLIGFMDLLPCFIRLVPA